MTTERSIGGTRAARSTTAGRSFARAALASACWFAWAGGCGGKSDSVPGNVPVVGSESHFLMRCIDTCDSDALACIGGICTQSCIIGGDSCGALASAAVCTDQSVEPGNVAVCDVSCSTREDCAALGENHLCEGGFCRSDISAVGLPLPPVCEDYRDQTPPPVVRGITLVNTGATTLYIQPHHPMCSIQSSLVRVYRIDEPGSTPSELNLQGFVCVPQCGDVMDSGWPYEGEGSLANECPGATCISPPPAVALEPGASLFEAARTPWEPVRLPRDCASGITTEAVNCMQRLLPPSLADDTDDGTYRFSVSAALTPECGDGCEPITFTLDDPGYFYADQVFELSAATP
jgi:hypothetical protein